MTVKELIEVLEKCNGDEVVSIGNQGNRVLAGVCRIFDFTDDHGAKILVILGYPLPGLKLAGIN